MTYIPENIQQDNVTIDNGDKRYTDPNTGRFIKGNPGGGRKPGRRIPDILTKVGNEEVTFENGEKMNKLELILRQVFKFAKEGHAWAVQFIADRLEGKAVERIESVNMNIDEDHNYITVEHILGSIDEKERDAIFGVVGKFITEPTEKDQEQVSD